MDVRTITAGARARQRLDEGAGLDTHCVTGAAHRLLLSVSGDLQFSSKRLIEVLMHVHDTLLVAAEKQVRIHP